MSKKLFKRLIKKASPSRSKITGSTSIRPWIDSENMNLGTVLMFVPLCDTVFPSFRAEGSATTLD